MKGTAGTGPSRERLLAIYLRQHCAASRGGLALFERAARTQSDPAARQELDRLAREVAEDRAVLRSILAELGIPAPRLGEALMHGAEVAGRLKPNGTLLRRSPLSEVVELEALGTAVRAKRLGWLALREVAASDTRLDVDRLDGLVRRAADQEERLERLRLKASRRAFARSAGVAARDRT